MKASSPVWAFSSSVWSGLQALIGRILRLFPGSEASSGSPTKAAYSEFLMPHRKQQSRMDDTSLQGAIAFFKEAVHFLSTHMGVEWVANLPRPNIQQLFPGWGFIGTTGFKVNERVSVYEHDDCMDFTSVLVTVDGHPVLILEVNQYRFTVLMVSEDESYFADTINPCGLFRLESVSDFKAMPEPIQRVVHEVLEKVFKRSKPKTSPTEVLLDYHSKPIAEGAERAEEKQHG